MKVLVIPLVYEKAKEELPASRFRISAREIVRQGQRGATWFITSLYRIFAAYGERPGLALLWLGFLVLIAFPLSFISAA
jgi:hypothetical protein